MRYLIIITILLGFLSCGETKDNPENKDFTTLFEKSDGTVTEPGQETLRSILDAHFGTARPKLHLPYHSRNNIKLNIIEEKYEDWIDYEKVKAALGGFNKKKSPGPDGIKPCVFDHLGEKFTKYLQIIYKCCIHFKYTPKLWRET